MATSAIIDTKLIAVRIAPITDAPQNSGWQDQLLHGWDARYATMSHFELALRIDAIQHSKCEMR